MISLAAYPEKTFIKHDVDNRNVYLYRQGAKGPIVFWLYKFWENEAHVNLEQLLCKADIKADFLLVLVEIDDWNKELSPWLMSGQEAARNFSGGGEEFYKVVLFNIINKISTEFPTFNHGKYIVGYSLAGLFALWLFYSDKIFSGVAACSASLWFKDWDKFMQQAKAPADSHVYLSLGGKESQSKDILMQTIDTCYNKQYSLAKQDKNIKKVVYQKNEGGHFANTDLRVINGIKWLLENRCS